MKIYGQNRMMTFPGEVGGVNSKGESVKIGATEFTKAVARYARRHGVAAATVRTVTELRRAAFSEWVS